jgi:hypothetical protein
MIHVILRIHHVQYLMGVQVYQEANILAHVYIYIYIYISYLNSKDRFIDTAEEYNRCEGFRFPQP